MLEGTASQASSVHAARCRASTPKLRFASKRPEGPRPSLLEPAACPLLAAHASVWFRPGRDWEAGRRRRRKFLFLRAGFVDVSWALALKGAGALCGEATHFWKSRGSGLRKWDSASGSALWCGLLRPDDEGFGPGPSPTPTPASGGRGGSEAPQHSPAPDPAPRRSAFLSQPCKSLLCAPHGSPDGVVPWGTPPVQAGPALVCPANRVRTFDFGQEGICVTCCLLSHAREYPSGLLCPAEDS